VVEGARLESNFVEAHGATLKHLLFAIDPRTSGDEMSFGVTP